VVLAAGEGARFEERFKLLLPWGRRTVVAATVEAAIAAGLEPVLVVVGHRGEEVRRALEGRPVRVVENPRWARGQAGSLGRGIAEVRRDTGAPAAAVLLGDEPGISPGAIRTVVDAWRASRSAVLRAVYEDRSGHPVVFDRSVFRALENLEGDEGARTWIASAGVGAEEVALDGLAPVDLDTPAAYRAALEARPPDDASGSRTRGGA
jgi:molybdenum cofactor cytidylyltransferase